MADTPVTLTTITNALAQKYGDQISRQMNRTSVLLSTLSCVPGSGKNIAWDAEFSGAIAENFSDADAVSNYGSDITVPATLSYGLVRGNGRIGIVARAAARAAGNPSALVDLIGEKVLGTIEKVTSTINSQGYTGNGTSGQLDGLTNEALLASGSYAGISRATYTEWASSYMDDGASTPITLALLRKDINQTILTAGRVRPDLGLCAPATYLKIASLFDANKQFVVQSEVTLGNGRKLSLDGSAGAIMVDGCAFVMDKDAPSGSIIYLNTNAVRFEYLPLDGGPDANGENVQANDGMQTLPLGMRLDFLGKTGADTKFTLQTAVNIVVRHPNQCGYRVNLATT